MLKTRVPNFDMALGYQRIKLYSKQAVHVYLFTFLFLSYLNALSVAQFTWQQII
jgi:hypothetical protein